MQRLLLLSLFAIVLSGCRFSREIVNPHIREIDTSWIVPGLTTRDEIVKRIGLPPLSRDGGGGGGRDTLRWVCTDTYTWSFEAGYIVTPTFEHGDGNYAEDIMIVFDKDDKVTLVSRTRIVDDKVRQLEWREAAK